MEEEVEEISDDFDKLKIFYFNLGIEFRKVVIEYDINHDNISENTINIFLKQKPFTYLLTEKFDDELMDYTDNNTPEIDNKQEKKDIETVIKEKEDKEMINNKEN